MRTPTLQSGLSYINEWYIETGVRNSSFRSPFCPDAPRSYFRSRRRLRAQKGRHETVNNACYVDDDDDDKCSPIAEKPSLPVLASLFCLLVCFCGPWCKKTESRYAYCCRFPLFQSMEFLTSKSTNFFRFVFASQHCASSQRKLPN